MELDILDRSPESTRTAISETVTRGYKRGRTLRNRLSMVARRRRLDGTVGRVHESEFDRVLDRYADEDVVFVHVGLSDVERAFDREPYEFIVERLEDRFDSILVPGFTPMFRSVDGGVYHKRYSQPKFGTFARLFLEDCDYRTDDPTNSILVRGPYRFDDCDQFDTWSEQDCFAKLDRENVLYLNVGTDWIRSSQIHYVENRLDVPYVRTEEYDGVIYRDEHDHETVTHRSHEYTMPVTWNREKLRRDLEEWGVLESYDLNGLSVFAYRARELRDALTREVEADPYYLVT
jgi:aminoglycoside N3'-acetyltransferase